MAALMIQGCGSDVGKSVLAAGLCRLFANRGVSVRPFKPQNMSNNAAVTADGGEIGRAQALQALACRTPATVDMNPVLLKPQSDVGAQLVVRGRMAGTWSAGGYQGRKAALLEIVLESFRTLQSQADLVIVEGAGSPAEINLRAGDIANMGFACAAHVPVVLVGDIDRGHVIAALVGAHAVLDEADRAMVGASSSINFAAIRPCSGTAGRRSRAAPAGPISAWRLGWPRPASVTGGRRHDYGAPHHPQGRAASRSRSRCSRASPISTISIRLRAEPQVDFDFVPPGRALPGDADLIILPGTKATLADLAFLRAQGWDIDLAAHVRRGGRVLGVCGGYQMLGQRVADPDGIEGPAGAADGLGLLEIETVLTGAKVLRPAGGRLLGSGARFEGYEIHIGRTTGPALLRPLLFFDDGAGEGAVSADGRVAGCYVHGLFNAGPARTALLIELGAHSNGEDQAVTVDRAIEEIAGVLNQAFDIPALAVIAGLETPL